MEMIDKTILLTGASTGIGKQLAIDLAEKHNRLVLIARREHLLKELVSSLPVHNEGHLYYACDVSDFSAVDKICLELNNKNIVFDILIMNAGIGGVFHVHEIDIEKFHQIMDTNFTGNLYFFKHLLPPMILRKSGLVTAVSSLAGYRGTPRSAPYSASKAALSILMECLRIDLLKSGIKVTLISPGFVETPMTDKNKFKMPFMITAKKASKIIINGLKNEKTEIHFPYRLSLIAKIGKLLPNNFYAKLMQGRK